MTATDPAISGGPPAFAEPRHVGAPNVAGRERLLARIEEVLDRNRLTNNGPFVREFEEAIAARAGVAHAVAVCNATAGLQVAIQATGLRDEVIVPAWTFAATAHALQWAGITPVFADVRPDTQTLDPDAVAAAITPRTTGILGVHLFARTCDTDRLQRLADDAELTLLYDAAHAFGASRAGRPVGGFGHAEVFSFHATKFLNSFEGGAVVTDDDELADRLRLLINFGFRGRDQVISVGINAKMHEVSAAMGLTQLEHIDETIAANRERLERYRAGLAVVPGVDLVPDRAGDSSNHQYVVVRVDQARAGLSRDELLRSLEAENVLARRYFHPGVHRMEPYRTLQPDAGLRLPVTERLSDVVLVLPTGTAISPADVGTITELIASFVDRALARRRRDHPTMVDAREPQGSRRRAAHLP